jgi:hypothetical protein
VSELKVEKVSSGTRAWIFSPKILKSKIAECASE